MSLYRNFLFQLWRVLFKILDFFNSYVEDMFFLNNNSIYYGNLTFKKLSFYQKFFLVLTYTRHNFKQVSLFIKDLEKVNYYRLVNYPLLHLFFIENNKFKKKVNKKKVLNYLRVYKFTIFDKPTDFNTFEIILKSYEVDYNKNIFWEHKLFNLNSDLKSKKYIARIYDLKSINGFYSFFRNVSLSTLESIYSLKDKNVFVEKDKKNYSYTDDTYLKIIQSYNKFYRNIYKNFANKTFYEIFDFALKYSPIVINKNFLSNLQKFYPIKYKPTDVTQYLTAKKSLINLFIRKNKIFNKGRYSRNRQLYRTGVYWCLWLNIIAVFGLYYYFYRFVFNFGYMYLPLLILILSIFGSRIVKYRFYNVLNILNEIKLFLNIVESFVRDISLNGYKSLKRILSKFFHNIKLIVYLLK